MLAELEIPHVQHMRSAKYRAEKGKQERHVDLQVMLGTDRTTLGAPFVIFSYST